MANYPYDEVGTKLDRTFAATLNKNFDEIEDDIRQLVETVGPILDDSFDSAALAAEFEERLNNEIQKLQPDWVEFKQNTTAQLAQTERTKADIAYVDQQISRQSGGAIKGTYTTLNALKEAYPNGTVGPFLVEENENRYIWDVNKLDWISIGPYDPAEIAKGSVGLPEMNSSVYNNIWDYYRIEPSNSGKNAFVEYTFIRSIQGSGRLPIKVDFDFYSEDANIKEIKITLYHNNSLDSVTGGDSIASTTILPYTPRTVAHYHYDSSIGAEYSHIHALVSVIPINNTVSTLNFYVSNFKYQIENQIPTYQRKRAYLGTMISQKDSIKIPIQFATSKEVEDLKNEIVAERTWFYGKRGVAFGDSITWQDGKPYAKDPYTGQIARGYQSIIKDKLGLESYVNQGSNGATIVSLLNYLIRTFDYSTVDFVTIFLLTNDYGNSTPLGELGEVSQTTFDETTAYGAYRAAVEHILSQNPEIKIFLITPMFRNFNYPVNHEMDTPNSAGHTMSDLQQIPRKVGEIYSKPVIDLAKYSGLNNLNIHEETLDGLHPVDSLYENIGTVIANEMIRYV